MQACQKFRYTLSLPNQISSICQFMSVTSATRTVLDIIDIYEINEQILYHNIRGVHCSTCIIQTYLFILLLALS